MWPWQWFLSRWQLGQQLAAVQAQQQADAARVADLTATLADATDRLRDAVIADIADRPMPAAEKFRSIWFDDVEV